MMPEMLEVRDVMTPTVVSEDENVSITKLSTVMEITGIGSVVITRGGKPVGIVTDRDIAIKVMTKDKKGSEIKAKEIMSTPLITIEPDLSLEKACEILAEKGVRQLPVVDDVEELVGIVSVRNVLTRSPMCVHKFYPAEDEK
jgi:CBS domain-containing protein